MTLDEIRESPKAVLTCEDVSEVLSCHPQTLRLQARQMPERLGFPVIVMGGRVKIPRLKFLEFMGVTVNG